MTLTISLAGLEDAEALAALAGELGYPATPGAMQVRLADLLARPDDHRIWVARFEDRPIAWLHAFAARYLVDDPYAEIAGLVVAEGERGHGVGALLLKAVEVWARAQGFNRVGVHSNVLRADAHRFYERAGFVLEKRQGVFTRRLA